MRGLWVMGWLLLSPLVWAGQQVGEQSTYQREMGMEMQVSYVASGNGVGMEEYIGLAFPGQAAAGTELTAAIWQIYRLTYDSSHRVATRCWANQNDAYTRVWADRTTYQYC